MNSNQLETFYMGINLKKYLKELKKTQINQKQLKKTWIMNRTYFNVNSNKKQKKK